MLFDKIRFCGYYILEYLPKVYPACPQARMPRSWLLFVLQVSVFWVVLGPIKNHEKHPYTIDDGAYIDYKRNNAYSDLKKQTSFHNDDVITTDSKAALELRKQFILIDRFNN